jgi:hypothetical protein
MSIVIKGRLLDILKSMHIIRENAVVYREWRSLGGRGIFIIFLGTVSRYYATFDYFYKIDMLFTLGQTCCLNKINNDLDITVN